MNKNALQQVAEKGLEQILAFFKNGDSLSIRKTVNGILVAKISTGTEKFSRTVYPSGVVTDTHTYKP